ncbi:MAG TPA: phosphatidylserine decarboxylase [Bryobacteraceae bacterium]|jgi:phosphatidylserine decarboxylase|nr:phosphatidylserine decarboxylase [Bryobacteraceae bacterium]
MVIYGIYYALALAGAGVLISFVLSWPWAVPLYALAGFCLWFFRDPEREAPPGPVAVSPADGKIVSIKSLSPALTRISIFLNIFDVHVNRSPIAGRITEVRYQPGQFLVASREEASAQNEQNTVVVQDQDTTVTFKQIAGLIARRIICYKKPGDVVTAGERIGLIRFGSRVDVFLGPEWNVSVRTGERVKAGASVLARRRS